MKAPATVEATAGKAVLPTKYPICQRCVMDSSHHEIEFDTNGVCNFCHSYERMVRGLPSPAAGKDGLERLIAGMKKAGQGKEYDCTFGISGGVDSSFLAYKLKEWGLRPLAIQFDNGWNSELAVKNIERVCRKLDIDLFTYVVDWEEFKDLQLAFLRASVTNFEAPSDHGIFGALYRVTAERGLKFIVAGMNIVTEGLSSSSYGYRHSDLGQLRSIHRRFGRNPIKTFPELGLLRQMYYDWVARIRVVTPLNYIDYNKAKAMEFLEKTLGWQYYGGKHFESIITRFHQTYILPRKFKIDKRRLHLSNLICSGQITRDEALAELEKPACSERQLQQDREFVIKKLGITEEEFETLMNERPKSHKEYQQSDWLYRNYSRLDSRMRRLERLFLRTSS